MVDEEARHLGLEVYLSSITEDGVANGLNDLRKTIGTDMGMGIGQDGGGGSMLTEHPQYLVNGTAFLGAGIEFAVGVGACPTLAETIVALAVHLLGAGDHGQVFLAVMDILSPLQDDGTKAQLDEAQGGEESAGASTDNDNLRTVGHIMIGDGLEEVILDLLVDIHTEAKIDIDGTLTGIDGASQEPNAINALRVNAILFSQICHQALLLGSNGRQYSYLKFSDHRWRSCRASLVR
jgi:hypothetical protein